MGNRVIKHDVVIPSGDIKVARISTVTVDGYRGAYIRMADKNNKVRTITGRVTSKHGFKNDYVLPFEISTHSINAHILLSDKHKVNHNEPERFVTE